MKSILPLFLLFGIVSSCNNDQPSAPPPAVDWSKKLATISKADSLQSGSTYLSVYSHIYALSEKQTTNLTGTISMRNTSQTDTLFIARAEYFDTQGKSVKNYIDKPIFLAPMETAEIIIEQNDATGGSGANFIFDWMIKRSAPEPLFEAIMISTSGGQGLSFITQGKRIK
jgi:Protein of unknown function (DUF3124)